MSLCAQIKKMNEDLRLLKNSTDYFYDSSPQSNELMKRVYLAQDKFIKEHKMDILKLAADDLELELLEARRLINEIKF